MKNKSYLYAVVLLSFCLSACELDNYNAPDSQLFGSVIDEDTNAPIQQDLIEGSRIDKVEQGFDNPNIRQIRFHTGGTYEENNIFSGTYEVQALRGNFFPTFKEIIDINGRTEHHFRTRPYIRINDVELTFDELRGEVVAGFTLDQVATNPVASVHLIADANPNVSNSLRTLMSSQNVNAVVPPERTFQLKLSTENLVSGNDYYFRVAALISGIGEAKHNYSAPVKMHIDNSQVIPDLPIPGKVLDDCESLEGWLSNWTLSLDYEDMREGNASLKAENQTGPTLYRKNFDPFDTEVTRENGYLAFDLYISDVAQWGPGDSQFELTSSGLPDVQEVSWNLHTEFGLVSGWNRVELSLAKANPTVDLQAVNFIRFYHTNILGPVVFKIDHIRFYSKY